MSHKKPGFILFLMFSLLSLCMVLVSLYFSQTVVYRQLMSTLTRKTKAELFVQNCSNLAFSVLTVQKNKQEKSSTAPDQKPDPLKEEWQILLRQIFAYFNKQQQFELSEKNDGMNARITLEIMSEQGKLNLNSVFDFEKKKFINEGQADDRKKFCIWLFEKIANLTKEKSLFPAFEQFIKQQEADLNDVTQLMNIKEFQEIFKNKVFVPLQEQQKQTAPETQNSEILSLYLTDIFTVSTEQETINPWLFSSAWCTILNLKPKKELSKEEQDKLFAKCSKTSNWATDWDKNVKDFYQKEYKDLPEEIKSMLTTEFEANIFSLSLKANMQDTNATIFMIIRSQNKNNLAVFDIIKIYQV